MLGTGEQIRLCPSSFPQEAHCVIREAEGNERTASQSATHWNKGTHRGDVRAQKEDI